MKLYFKCGCGLYNYNFEDWIAHFKYGKGFWNAVKLLAITEIHLKNYYEGN